VVCTVTRSQSHIATDCQPISKSWCRAPSAAHDQIFISPWHLRSCFCGAPSLTRGRVCLLYMLLALASAVPWISRPYFTVSDLRLPFSSPPTTRRVTVEVFEPASTRVLRNYSSWLYSPGTDRTETSLPLLRVLSLPGKNVSTEMFPSNGWCTVAYLHSRYWAMGLHVTIPK
jgi:hypothetical protein